MCGAPSAPKQPTEKDIAVQRRFAEIKEENARAGKPTRGGLLSADFVRAILDPKYQEIQVSKETQMKRQERKARARAGGTIATSALGIGGGGDFGRSVLTGGGL